jgi:Holliday junction resolvasome RuvABC endonuclease subunit
MTRVLGIDPGAVSGGLAILEIMDGAALQLVHVIDLPTVGVKAKQRIDVLALRNWIQQHRPDHAYIERGQAHPQQGASSGFKYGRGCGSLETVIQLLEIPMTIVEPSVWKRKFHLRGKDKEGARQLALLQFPNKHDLFDFKAPPWSSRGMLSGAVRSVAMKPFIDITGERFGRWIVLAIHPERYRRTQTLWLCHCDCGTERVVLGNSLRHGRSLSCGCLRRELHIKRLLIHGHSRGGYQTRVFQAWQHMLRRCLNSQHKDYRYYGGRGVTVCERWRTFENFLVDMGYPPPGLTLDRIDPSGNYEPSNCRWATRAEQTTNRRPFKQEGLRGERGPGAKLSTSDVAQIHALRGTLPQHQIAQRFGISQSNVSMIQTGKTWIALTPMPGVLPKAVLVETVAETVS